MRANRINLGKSSWRLRLVKDEESDEFLAREAVWSKEALGILCEKYIPRIYGFALRRTGDISDAEDITSSVFEKVVANIHGYDASKASFATWIYRIALNTVNDYFRARKRKMEISCDQHEGSFGLALAGVDEVVSSRVDILGLIGSLPSKYREALELRYFAGLRVGEIAQVLGISETAASKRILRGLERIRASFSEEIGEGTASEVNKAPQE